MLNVMWSWMFISPGKIRPPASRETAPAAYGGRGPSACNPSMMRLPTPSGRRADATRQVVAALPAAIGANEAVLKVLRPYQRRKSPLPGRVLGPILHATASAEVSVPPRRKNAPQVA